MRALIQHMGYKNFIVYDSVGYDKTNAFLEGLHADDLDRETMRKDMERAIYEREEESDDGNPYCECNEQPYEEEEASNICSACGKLLS